MVYRKAAGYDSIDVSKLPGKEVLQGPGSCICAIYCTETIFVQVNLVRLNWLESMAKQKCIR